MKRRNNQVLRIGVDVGIENAFGTAIFIAGVPEPKAGCSVKYGFSTPTRVGDNLNFFPYLACAEDPFFARKEGMKKQQGNMYEEYKALGT